MIGLARVDGSPYMGVYCAADDSVAVIGFDDQGLRDILVKYLEVEDVIVTTIEGSRVIGSLIAVKDGKAVVSQLIEDDERRALEEHFEVLVLPSPHTALGNNILIGRSGILVNPDFSDDEIELLKDFFGMPVEKGTLARTAVVGSAGVANDRGILVHPKATSLEKEKIRSFMGYDEVHVGTANYGVPFVGACLVANNKGVITGETSTGIELGRIEDALLYVPPEE